MFNTNEVKDFIIEMERGFRSSESVYSTGSAPANIIALVCACARVCGQFYQDPWVKPADTRAKLTLADSLLAFLC